jgi:hypothetical protein
VSGSVQFGNVYARSHFGLRHLDLVNTPKSSKTGRNTRPKGARTSPANRR